MIVERIEGMIWLKQGTEKFKDVVRAKKQVKASKKERDKLKSKNKTNQKKKKKET